MDLSAFFDGMGAQIVSAVIGALLTAAISIPVSYKAGAKSVSQKQVAGDDSTQTQIGVLHE